MLISHTFPIWPLQPFKCQEVLYVSDHSYESHYRKDHPKNDGMQRASNLGTSSLIVPTCLGAEIAGRIIVDMTFLRKQRLIQPTEDSWSKKKFYKVEFELVMIVDGRNLRYEARWPIGDGAQVQNKGQTCIAAAFVPGTR